MRKEAAWIKKPGLGGKLRMGGRGKGITLLNEKWGDKRGGIGFCPHREG